MNKRFIILPVVFVIALALLYSVKDFFKFPAVKTSELKIEDLMNITLPPVEGGILDESVTLKDGEYVYTSEGFDPIIGREITPFTVTKTLSTATSTYATGDINNDDVDDVVATLVENSGGTGWFYSLFAYINDKGKPKYAGQISLGDRIDLQKVSIDKGVITVDMITQGPDDGLCCPTMPQVTKYMFDGGQLKEI